MSQVDLSLAKQRYEKMTTGPVSRLILSMSVPAIASLIISSLYNIADTYFISQISTSATAAPGIAMPLFQIIQAIALAFAIGAGSYATRARGSKDDEAADRSISTAFFMSIFVCAVVGVMSIIFLNPILTAFGATPTILPYAWDFAFYVILATPFFSATFVLSQAIRQEGSIWIAVAGTVSGAVINVILAPLFIFVFHMGIIGAAVATSISQTASFFILLSYVLRGKSVLKISWKYFTPNWATLSEILKIGSPDFFRICLLSLSGILLNNAAAPYGDAALAGMTVASRIINILTSILMGLGQGFQPMCGYCYGAKLYKRVMRGFGFVMLVSMCFAVLSTVVGTVFGNPIMGFFRAEDAAFRSLGAMILKAQLFALPMATVSIIANMLFQSCGRAMQSGILALSRNGIFFIPLILTLPSKFQFNGVIYSQPISDTITAVIALVMLALIVVEFRRKTAPPTAPSLMDEVR